MLYNKITKTLFQRGRYKQGSEAHHPTAPEDYYCSIYFEALGIISVFIKARFRQLSFKDFLNLESVFLQVVNNSNITIILCLLSIKRIARTWILI